MADLTSEAARRLGELCLKHGFQYEQGAMFFMACVVAMIVHIWVCVATNWAAMLILGLVFFPVGVVHGFGVILGFW